MTKAKIFRNKGASILRGKPNGIGDFLNDSSLQSKNVHLHNSTKSQIPISIERKDELGRLHIQIKRDLIDKLMETVYKRKADPQTIKRNATQRAVVEEALELYFQKLPQDSLNFESKGNNFDIENN